MYKIIFFCVCNFDICSSFAETILHINCAVWQQVATATATKNISYEAYVYINVMYGIA